MNRDSFYQEILEGLKKRLDPDLFEACAADLLRSVYPTLVPIRGGDDAGMDGAIADTEGEPFPLVSTISKDVIGNLTRNLRSYIDRGGSRRKVILATSQYLTQRRRENLFSRASELGFTLINIHDQDAIANLLYRSPEWCKELLDLSGDPSPLSAVPRTTRPQLAEDLIGRDEALAWLNNLRRDGLLVGQPGSGKTSLLQNLVDQGRALFVISDDRGEIAAAIRKQQDDLILIVDDAHLYSAIIPDLLQIREEMGATYSILASCWPTAQSLIAADLNLSADQICELNHLTRDEMVEVVKTTNLSGPNDLVREIVDQALGRPGLAVTLSLLCLKGGVRELYYGDALQGSLMQVLENLSLSRKTQLILAAFSIGGDSGMPISDVATLLNLSVSEVWETVTLLDESGIVYDAGQNNLSVQPAALRYALLRDVFFKRASPFPIDHLLAKTPNVGQTGLTLIGAKWRGANVTDRLLTEILGLSNTDEGWREYAKLGKRESAWVLENQASRLVSIAQPLLHHIPEATIPALLERAIGDHRDLPPNVDHPLRILGDWIKATHPHSGQAIIQRKILLDIALDWLQEGKDQRVGLYALEFSMNPGFEISTTDPGRGLTLTMHYGLLLPEQIDEIKEFWQEITTMLERISVEYWESIKRIIETWAYINRNARLNNLTVPEDVENSIQLFSAQMLKDIVSLVVDEPGIMHWASKLAEYLGVEISIPLDEDLQILYPDEHLEDWRAAAEQQADEVKRLAVDWSKRDPKVVIEKIVYIEDQAQKANLRWPRWTPYLCSEIANELDSVVLWLDAFIEAGTSAEFVEPFLGKVAKSKEPEWEVIVGRYLRDENYQSAAVTTVLRMEDPPSQLLAQVVDLLPIYSGNVKVLCYGNEIPEPTLKLLLQHEDSKVACAVAQGEWICDPQGSVRESVYVEWRKAIVNCSADESILEKVFQNEPALAEEWLINTLTNPEFLYFQQNRSVNAAIRTLGLDARKQMLDLIPPSPFQERLVSYLVGNDLELYVSLLKSKRLKRFHLAPLIGDPSENWILKAKLALEFGYTLESIAGAVHGNFMEWSGNESEMWQGWIDKFDPLCSHEDEQIRQIGIIGRDFAMEQRTKALEQERREAVFGRL